MTKDFKKEARKFKEYWLLAGESEVAGCQKFWLSLLGDVLGADEAMKRIYFEVPVPMGTTTKFIDAWIPETKVLIEQKKRGIKLDAAQSGHGGKTPYEQALEYNNARGYNEKARWIITSNFDEIWIYDMARPLAEPQKLNLGDLPREITRLAFLIDPKIDEIRRKEETISKQAGEIVGELYDALLKRYAPAPQDNGGAQSAPGAETLAALNRLCVRLVFCFYAEDAELFAKDSFWGFLKNTPSQFLRERLLRLFRVLDTPIAGRDPYLESEIAVFPYTNGGLFKNIRDAEVPPLDDEIKAMLVKASNFDWREISPTIFGALFESTLNPATRRSGGMVYTSIENIHKVIDPLFLDDLTARVDSLTSAGTKTPQASAKGRMALLALQEEMAALKFLDPACGSGNFLTETFLSLRKLENRLIAARCGDEMEFDLGDAVKVKITQFSGIEINDFAVAVAKTAMWISEAKMLKETAELLAVEPKYLPLHDYDGIIEGNALRLDWPKADYIMGNPPFVGIKSKEQAAEMIDVFGKDWKNVGSLDYVCAWYKKACDFSSASTRCAFVSTNSITQGIQVAALWKPLVERFGLEIDFAYRTFRWDNESAEKAHVHCVIVGFHAGECLAPRRGGAQKIIFDGDKAIKATHINGYLMDAPDIYVESRTKPLCDVPEIINGGKPVEGGNLILEEYEKIELLKKEPQADVFVRPFMMGVDFINRKPRYCLWLNGASPQIIRSCPSVMKRVANVREFRLASKKPATRAKAETPTLFDEIREPHSSYVAIPKVSSERRKYIPIDYLTKDIIPGDKLFFMPNSTLYHFGVLTSSVHMGWMRAVSGRLKSDYSYSNTIVYNNFPWPELCALSALREKIAQTAQAILEARSLYPDSSLADLYDPLTMPPELRRAHAANDRAVLEAYNLAPDSSEDAIIRHLFALYAQKVK